MSKSNTNEQLQSRLARISELQKIVEDANRQLMVLTGLAPKEPKSVSAPLPVGFMLKNEVLAIFKEKNTTFSSTEIANELKAKTGQEIARKNIQSCLDYLTNKGGLLTKEGEGRGNIKYRLI